MPKPFSHKRLVSAFIKAGCTVEQLPRHGTPHFMATNPTNGKKLDWYTQDAFVPAKNGIDAHYDKTNPVVSSVCSRHPDTDAMTDLFMDSFYDTIKGAVKAIQR
jgi:(2Fe-2S) ferredoxin